MPPLTENVENQKALPVRERLDRASEEPGVRGVPQDDGSDRSGAREFRRRRIVALGRQRRADRSVGQLYDGTKLDGPVSLRNAILNRSDAFVGSFTENLLAYGLGRLHRLSRHAGGPRHRAGRRQER